MKHSITSLIALGAATGLAYAASTFGAHPSATSNLRDAPVTQVVGDTYQTTDTAPFDSIGVTFPAPYCALSYAQGVHPITRVRGMGIDNRSDPVPDASLEDFTTIVGRVEKGELVDISVRGNTAGVSTEGVKVYIDWNQDGLFDDATEGYLIGYLLGSTLADGKQVSASIRVPGSAKTGETRMRVIRASGPMANPWSCNEGGAMWGQAEDYTLYVAGLESEDIFCSAFEAGNTGSCDTPPSADIVHSGPINVTIPPTATGLSINLVTGETSPNLAISHFNASKGDPYLFGPVMFFFWGQDMNNGGMAATNNGPYLVLGPGDTIGPSSTFIRYSLGTPSTMFGYWGGVNGYLGIRFMNEETGEINYGYLHMLTTDGSGFPAMILDYAYDKSGAAITIL